MSNLDENIERLIVRRLDGELTADQQLELDRTLLRCPEARALSEEYERIDAAAAEALASVVAEQGKPVTLFPASAQQPAPRSYSRGWWALPAAVAAAVVLLVLVIAPNNGGPQLVHQDATPAAEPPAPHAVPTQRGREPIRRAAQQTGAVDRATDTGLLYIIAPDGNVYVIEQQRVRTARRPNSTVRRASGDL